MSNHPPRWRKYAPEHILDAYHDPNLKGLVRTWIQEQLWCPACGHRCNQFADDREGLVTMHGDGYIHKDTCEHCGATFRVTESVRRTFYTRHSDDKLVTPPSIYNVDLTWEESNE